MKKRISAFASILLCALIITTAFCSCAKANLDYGDTDSFYASDESMGWASNQVWAEPEGIDCDMPLESPSMSEPKPGMNSAEGNPDTDAVKASDRKIIKNKTIEVETLEFDSFISELETSVRANGGYIESSNQNGNSYYSHNLRRASYVIRIPQERYDEFTALIGNMATVTYSEEYIDDITSKYVDVEARLSALRAEQESFLKLMDRAKTIEEILQIQSYLSDVNYRIESYTAQLNSYKSLVSYSTINLSISEVERITNTTVKPSVFERISSNLSDNLYNIGEGLKDMFVGIISSLPYLVIFAVTIIILIIICKLILKATKKTISKIDSIPKQEPKSDNKNNEIK